MGRARPYVYAVFLLLLLAPAAVLAWKWRAMPHLGAWHDDAVYWVSAKSLATGGGYRLLNLPGEPAQTKYPPLYPLLLSAVWRISPQFPDNAPLLMALQWTMLPALVVLLCAWFRQIGFTAAIALLLTAVVALCPMTTMFVTAPLTEVPFLIAVLGTMLAIGDGTRLTTQRALLAGACASAAVLMRSNGIVLAAAVLLALLSTRARRRHMAVFLVPVLVTFAGWEVWSVLARTASSTDIAAYYTDYAGFYRNTFSIAAFPRRVWINADGLLTAIGRLMIWSTSDATLYRQLCWVISIFSFAGFLKLFRRGQRVPVLFAGFFSALLLVWNFPADQRFAYPLLPFAVAGLATQITDIAGRMRVEWRSPRVSNRVAVVVMAAVVAAFATAVVLLDVSAYRRTLPEWMESQKTRAAAVRTAYTWIDRNTAANSVVAAYDDPLLYLFTGRRATSVAVLPALVYESSDAALATYVRRTVREWRESGVAYVLTTRYDFGREFQAVARDAEVAELRSGWKPVELQARTTIWKPVDAAPRVSLQAPRDF